MTLYPALITDALKTVRYPGNGKSLVENDMIADDIRIDGEQGLFFHSVRQIHRSFHKVCGKGGGNGDSDICES